MIHIILGRSGSGKTEKIHDLLSELPCDKEAVVIVPEQISFYHETKILDHVGPAASRNIKIFSFKRLCNYLFSEFHGLTEERINDGVKAVLMSMAIGKAPSEGGELELYKMSAGKTKKVLDLVEPMLTAVNEYKMCLITPEMLYEMAGLVDDKILASKLRDSAKIYAAYNALLENTYADPDDDLNRLYEILLKHDYFTGKNVYIDSFNGFSAQEIKIIERIVVQADEVYVTLCTDKKTIATKSTIFAETDDTYKSFLKLSQRTGKQCAVEQLATEGIRYKGRSIRLLENKIFAGYRRGSDSVKSEIHPDDSVQMYEASDLYDEIQYVARTIYRLVHDCGYSYSDIEVIGSVPENYKSIIALEFPKYNIPYFLSNPEPLEIKPIIRLMFSAFEIIHSGYDTESVLRYAKTGLTQLEEEEIFQLENYCYVWSIRGKRWKSQFTMSPDGNRDSDSENLGERIKNIEEIRKKLIEPLTVFEEKIKNSCSGDEITKVLYELMEEIGCREKFRDFIKSIMHSTDEKRVEREKSVWDIAMDILGKMYHVLKGKNIDSHAYIDLLKIYVHKSPISDIPRTLNSVTIGKAGNMRSAAPKIVFAIGATEGVFPAQVSAKGIFTDAERRFLRKENKGGIYLPLYDSIYGASLKERFNVYMVLSAPSEKLFISWYTQDSSGKSCEPSVIKSEVKKILGKEFPIHRNIGMTEDSLSDKEMFFTERQSFDLCASMWNSTSSRAAALRSYYLCNENYHDRAEAIQKAADRAGFRLKNLHLARKTYCSPMKYTCKASGKISKTEHFKSRKITGIKPVRYSGVRLSSSKIDDFAKCKFSYFCKYGLALKPLRKAEMDNGLYGSAMHYIFEKLLKNVGIDELKKMSENELKVQISTAFDGYLAEIGDAEERGYRFDASCRRIKKQAFRVLSRMCRQFQTDKFHPVDYELHIGGKEKEENSIPAYKLQLPTGDNLIISGYVDRVDTNRIDGNDYIRVVDYKTGNDDFKLKNIANGIKIQMLLYLSIILKNGVKKYTDDGKVLLPAGVLYVPSTAKTDAGLSTDSEIVEEKVKEQNRKLKMQGLLINDKTVLTSMEEDLSGNFIPANLKDNEIVGSVVSKEEFKMIFDYIDVCIKSMGVELFSGNIDVLPTKDACDYCQYSSVCRFEKGGRKAVFPSYKKGEELEKIKEALKNEWQGE